MTQPAINHLDAISRLVDRDIEHTRKAEAPCISERLLTPIAVADKGLDRETARRLIYAGHTVYVGAWDNGDGTAAVDALGARFVRISTFCVCAPKT